MGIQINGQTDTITAIDGELNVSGADLGSASAGSLNVTGIVTASGFSGALSGNVTGNVSGNISAAGVSTFTNGPVFIGTGTSTGTASQPLQVTGGAYVSGNLGIGINSPDTTTHIQRSAAQNDTHGILKVENTNSTSGGATNSSLIIKNKYGWSQFMQWENFGLRIGSRNITGGSAGGIYFTYGADNEGIILDSSGRVRMPSQPSGAWYLGVNASSVRSVTINKNIGNNISSVFSNGTNSTYGSVGRFTAPVAGAYLFSLFATGVSATSNALMSVYGSWTSGTNNIVSGSEVFDCRNTRPPNDGGGWAQVFYFSTNDYWEIDWYRPAPTSYNDTGMLMMVTVHLLG